MHLVIRILVFAFWFLPFQKAEIGDKEGPQLLLLDGGDDRELSLGDADDQVIAREAAVEGHSFEKRQLLLDGGVTISYRGDHYDPHDWRPAKLLRRGKHWKQVIRQNIIRTTEKKARSEQQYVWLVDEQWQQYLVSLYKPETASQRKSMPHIDDIDMIYMAFGGKKLLHTLHLERCPTKHDIPADHFNVHAIGLPSLTDCGTPAGCDDEDSSSKLTDGAVYFHRSTIRSFPFDACANGTWVEVSHCGGSKFETFGVWHYGFRGSGLYVNVGKTIAFENHQDAAIHFLGKPCTSGAVMEEAKDRIFQCNKEIPLFLLAAKSAGFDSVQFTHHCDAFCDGGDSAQNCGLEVVLAYSAGSAACPAGVTYRTGLNASKTCTCDGNLGLHSYRGKCAACAEWQGSTEIQHTAEKEGEQHREDKQERTDEVPVSGIKRENFNTGPVELEEIECIGDYWHKSTFVVNAPDQLVPSCVVDALPGDNRAQHPYAVALLSDADTKPDIVGKIPRWARPDCPVERVLIKPSNAGADIRVKGKGMEEYVHDSVKEMRPDPTGHCWIPYKSCSDCWLVFAESTQRFKTKPEAEVRFEMSFATWMRENKESIDFAGRAPKQRESEVPASFWANDVACERPCHLRHCFSCEHVTAGLATEPLGVLRGDQTFVDRHLVLQTQNAITKMEPPVSDQLVMEMKAPSKDAANGFGVGLGFPGSVMHNDTHFVMYYHRDQK
jgi:hypothetical protein